MKNILILVLVLTAGCATVPTSIRLPVVERRCCIGHIDGARPITIGLPLCGALRIGIPDPDAQGRNVSIEDGPSISPATLEEILRRVRANRGGFPIVIFADDRLECGELTSVLAVLQREPPSNCAFELAGFDRIYFSPAVSTNDAKITIEVTPTGVAIEGRTMRLHDALETIRKLQSLDSHIEYQVFPAARVTLRDLIPVLAAVHRESDQSGIHLQCTRDGPRRPQAQPAPGHVPSKVAADSGL